MKISLYNQVAEKIGTIDLSDKFFALPINQDLIYQVVTSQLSNRRKPIAHTKDRGEVRGGGKKPWRQKGTGRARHGSIRSPIWKGGGVTFGPRNEKNFKKAINKKMARKALYTVLSSKFKNKEAVVIDDIKLENWKTKEMAKTIKNLSALFPSSHASLLLVTGKNTIDTILRSSNNLKKVDVMEARNLSALDVVARKNLILLKDAIELIERGRKS